MSFRKMGVSDFYINTVLLSLTLFSSATRSFINASTSSKTAPLTVATHPHTSTSVTKQIPTTSEITLKEAMNSTVISNITTQAAISTTSGLTVQTTSTTTQPPTTNKSSHKSETSTPVTTQAPTTNIPSQRLTSTTTTTSSSTELPNTNISSHTTQTSTAATTTTIKTTKQTSNTSTHTTETSTSITSTSSNSTEPIAINISSHTSQTSTPTTITTSNSTELPTTEIPNHTSKLSTPTTTTTSNSAEPPTINVSSHITQTSTPTTTTTNSTTELSTTNISIQTTQTSTSTMTTNSNTTFLSTASPSTKTSLLTTVEEILTSANVPKQTTIESSYTTTVTAAVENSSEEHIFNNSKSTTPAENDTSQQSSMQIKTTKSSSSTSISSKTPLTTNFRTTTSRPSGQQTIVNPVITTCTVPDTTLVPTEMLSLGINNTLSLQFTMLITMTGSGLERFNDTLFSYMLVRYVFVGYEVIPTVHVSTPPSKNTRYRRDDIRALFITRTVDESNSNHEANYSIVANIPVIKLREQRKTIKEFVRDISNNIRHNISNITSPAWQAVNTSDEIEKQLENQTEGITECHASGKLCPLGYDCCTSNEDHYTGICFHRCDLEKKECKNNGHCIFDSMINRTACSCQSTWISLYYGSNCEEQTGKLETVIGFTLGSAVLVIVLVFTAVLCCIRNRDGVKELRRHDDKSALESDFLSDSGGVQIMDLNYRKSTKFIPSSLDVDPVLKTLDPGPSDVNVSEILETSGCSTISSSNSSKTLKEEENKHQESTMSHDSDVRKPEDNYYVPTNFQSTYPPASTPEISRVSMKPKQENRINNRQTSFLFGP